MQIREGRYKKEEASQGATNKQDIDGGECVPVDMPTYTDRIGRAHTSHQVKFLPFV